jgi:GAF domain-containing protein
VTHEALLDELGRIAGGLGPALAPAGGDDLLRSIAATAQRQFGAAACSLALLSPDETELVFTTVVGAGAAVVTGLRIPSGHGIAGWVVMSGQPLAVSDLRSDPRWGGDALGAAPSEDVRVGDGVDYQPSSILAAPVATSQRMLGVLEVLDRDEQRPEASSDMELLGVVADQAALALEGARVFDDFGRQLLRAAATASGPELAVALDEAAGRLPPPEADLLELASLFGELGRLDAAARRLSVRVLREFVAHASAPPTRRSSRRG